jgi:microcystin-dependent protein
VLSISQNTAIFSILGTTYGGNGTTNFALPNLQGVTPISDGQGVGLGLETEGVQVGSSSITLTFPQTPPDIGGTSQPFDNYQPSLPVRYEISTEGVFPSSSGGGDLSMIGRVMPFAGNFDPGGFLECNGQLLSIAQYTALFSILGTTYGGDGVTTFALPDLRGRDIIGASATDPVGTTVGQPTVSLADNQTPNGSNNTVQPFDNREPSLALNYLIALQGIFPTQGGFQDFTTPLLGQIVAFAGTFAPKGWAFAAGQLLPINQNQALFSLLGTTYGGDGITTFALPDLRDRTIIGTGNGFIIGQLVGADSPTVTVAQLPPPCFCRGTLILTDRGEVPVEDLAIGDEVITVSGMKRPVKGIGRRAYDRRFVAGNRAVLPIRLEAGALADGVPARDLWLSPEHALYIDGVLVPAQRLGNGITIRQVESVDRIEYFHIELAMHDVILADGAPAETFVDCDNRGMFHNAGEFAARYPDDLPERWEFCAPRAEPDSPELSAIRADLLSRAAALGRITHDPDLHLVADGETVRAHSVAGRIWHFVLPAGACTLAVASRRAVPAEAEASSTDERALGVAVERIVLDGAGLRIETGHDCPTLCDGFHADEGSHRWTDGRGSVPGALLGCFAGGLSIEVHLAETELCYRLDPPAGRAKANGGGEPVRSGRRAQPRRRAAALI